MRLITANDVTNVSLQQNSPGIFILIYNNQTTLYLLLIFLHYSHYTWVYSTLTESVDINLTEPRYDSKQSL